MSKGFFGTFSSYLNLLIVAFFIFGAYKVATDVSVPDEVKETLAQQAIDRPFATGLFIRSLDEITPTVNYKLPGSLSEKEWFLVNEFPLPGYVFVLTTILLVTLSGMIMKTFHVKKEKQFLVFLAFIPVSYIAANLIAINVYYYTGNLLGFLETEATALRHSYSNSFDNVLTPLLIGLSIVLIKVGNVIGKRTANG